MAEDYEVLIKEKIKVLRHSTEECSKFYATDIIQGRPLVPVDIKEMALAFDKNHLIDLEYSLLLERAYPSRNHSENLRYWQEKVDEAKEALIKTEQMSF